MQTNPENPALSRHTIAFGLSLALASVVNGLLVIAKEKIPAVMTGMQKLGGHHWVSHSGIVIIVFAFFGMILTQCNGGKGIALKAGHLVGTLVSGVVLGSLLILGFYLLGD